MYSSNAYTFIKHFAEYVFHWLYTNTFQNNQDCRQRGLTPLSCSVHQQNKVVSIQYISLLVYLLWTSWRQITLLSNLVTSLHVWALMFQGQTKRKIMGEQSIHQPTYKDDQTVREKPHTQMIPSWWSECIHMAARSVLSKIRTWCHMNSLVMTVVT